MSTPESDTSIFSKARVVMRSDPQKALDMCKEYESENGESSSLHLTKVQAYNRLQDWYASLKSANDYVRLDPTEPMPYWIRAESAYHVGLYHQSVSDLHAAISLDSDSFLGSRPYRLLAMNHAQLGDLTGALAHADTADKLESSDWFPPVGPIPAGTMAEFKRYLTNIAQ